MAEQKIYIADKPTLDNVNEKVGNANDTTDKETVMAKLNKSLVDIQGTNKSIENLSLNMTGGSSSPYGNGMYGNCVYNDSDFVWVSQDGFNRYVLQFDSLTIPEGITMKPPAKCDGLYILSKGDVTINGSIDVTKKRKTYGNTNISSKIEVNGVEYELAKGGYSPKGGACGEGGKTEYYSKPWDTESSSSLTLDVTITAPAITPIKSCAGNVTGGGMGQSTISATTPVINVSRHWNSSDDLIGNASVEKALVPAENRYSGKAPGAVVIIAGGTVTVGSTGQIIATADNGQNAKDGYEPWEVSSGTRTDSWSSGDGGFGAIPPSGGGAVTIICKTFSNSGIIDTSGAKLISPDGADSTASVYTLEKGAKFYPGKGGKGGTFISTAGEIKVYETGGEA